jgi:hypothetical protein
MIEAVRTSETSVNFNVTTWRYIPEDSKLHDVLLVSGLGGLKFVESIILWSSMPIK